jgi:hypothetical protein
MLIFRVKAVPILSCAFYAYSKKSLRFDTCHYIAGIAMCKYLVFKKIVLSSMAKNKTYL